METPPQNITPDTHVRLKLERMLALLIGIVGGAVAATTVVIGWKDRVEAHMANQFVHVEPDFSQRHGHLVGTYDLDQSLTEMRKAAEDEKAAVDKLTLTPIHFE